MLPPAEDRDLWIVGLGPAGLALAQSCLDAGVELGLIAPDPRQPWSPNYGLWLDDAERLGVQDHLAQRWPTVCARFSGDQEIDLERGYGLLDARRWQLDILDRCAQAGVPILDGVVEQIEHDDEGVGLKLADGRCLRGKLVVDATGHGSTHTQLERAAQPGYQVALGELWSLAPGGQRPQRVRFMDWTSTGDQHERGEALPPTFAYVLPFGDERVFIEETVLVAQLEDPAATLELLDARLERRIGLLGIELLGDDPLAVERCVIPMGGPLPRGGQRTLAFGGAAAMVHPASGYMLTNVLHRRARVAAAIASELQTWVSPGAPSRRLWQVIWPPSEVRSWRLYRFGMDVLMAMDRSETQRFFAEFFELDEARWRGFLSASASTSELMQTMLLYFAAAPASIRRRLWGRLLGRGGLTLARGFSGLERR